MKLLVVSLLVLAFVVVVVLGVLGLIALAASYIVKRHLF